MESKLKKAYWVLSNQLGIDPRRLLRSLRGAPRYLRDLNRFRHTYNGRLELLPCLHDWYEEAGTTRSDYFLQDLYVAQKIHRRNPVRHVDIGSRVDGFVGHVASFREIEVFDIRAITATLPGIRFRQADLMNPAEDFIDYCDSLSCLHALEHFGLGRYGDTVDSEGSEVGLRHMTRIVKTGGHLYLSVPVGIERILFNAHRVFNPRTIVRMAEASGLSLQELAIISPDKSVTVINDWDAGVDQISKQDDALGIFTFVRLGPTESRKP